MESARPRSAREGARAATASSPGAGGAGIWPMRPALARMAGVLRAATTAAAVVAALLGGGGPVTWPWLASAVAAVTAWTAAYLVVGWTRGLRPWLVAVDLLGAAAIGLGLGHLVPPAAVGGTANWAGLYAGMAVIAAQLAGVPALSLPGALLVTAGYVAGSRLAHAPGGGGYGAALFAVQAVVGSAVMAVALRAERAASRAFADLERARAADAVSAARRADERAQLRMIHNGPLTTLTMALHAGAGPPSAVLRARAGAALRSLPPTAAVHAAAGEPARPARLDRRLAQTLVWYQPPLQVSARLSPCSVPAEVAEAFAAAAAEALENTARHAACVHVAVELADTGRHVSVTVADQGRGFDPARRPPGFGLREDVAGRMAAVGGTAAVRSGPGRGTVVHLGWARA